MKKVERMPPPGKTGSFLFAWILQRKMGLFAILPYWPICMVSVKKQATRS